MNLHNVVGFPLVGTWLNVLLYGLEIIAFCSYIAKYPSDHPIFKVVAVTVFLFDTVSTVTECASVYLSAVVNFGDWTNLQKQDWFFPLHMATTCSCAAIVQIFLLGRYWNLTQRKLVTCALGFMILVSLGGSGYTSFVAAQYNRLSQWFWAEMRLSATIWLAASAVTDVAIAVALIIELASSEVLHKSSKRLIRRLITLSLKTGLVCAISTLITMVTGLISLDTNLQSLLLGYCLGRIYGLTLFYNLNIRRSLRRQNTMIDVETPNILVTTQSEGPETTQSSLPSQIRRPNQEVSDVPESFEG